MQDKIQDLRLIGDFDGALTELLRSIERGEREAYLRRVLGRRCLLLDRAQRNKRAGFDRSRFDLLLSVGDPSAQLIPPRIDVLDAICGNHDDDGKILGLLQGAVRAYEAIWQYAKKPFVADVEARLAAQEAEPAFMTRLNPESRLRMRRLAAQSEFGCTPACCSSARPGPTSGTKRKTCHGIIAWRRGACWPKWTIRRRMESWRG